MNLETRDIIDFGTDNPSVSQPVRQQNNKIEGEQGLKEEGPLTGKEEEQGRAGKSRKGGEGGEGRKGKERRRGLCSPLCMAVVSQQEEKKRSWHDTEKPPRIKNTKM